MFAFDGLLHEIEEKVKRLERERERLSYLEEFFYGSNTAIIATDSMGNIQFFSRGAEKLTGYDAKNVRGKHISMLLRDGEENDEAVQSHEIHITMKNGTPLSVRSFISKSDEGTLIICMPESGETEDIFTKSVLFGVYVLQYGKIVYVNNRIEEILGYRKEELLGKPFLNFVHPEDAEIVRKRHAARVKKINPHYEIRVAAKKEEIHYIDVMEVPITYKGRKAILGNVIDITERRKAEEALYNSERKYRQVVENAVEGIYRITASGRFLEANSSFLGMFGYSDIGEMENAWNLYAQQQEVKQFLKKIRKEGKVKNYEMTGVRKDGKTIYTTQSAVLVNADGSEVIEGIIQDVTARKKAEAEAEFYNSLLRHDLGNKTQIVMGYLDLLERYDLPEKQREFLGKAYDAVKTGSDLIEKIRQIHQASEEISLKSMSLDRIVRRAIKHYSMEAERKGITIIYEKSAKAKVKVGMLVDEVIANVLENSINHSHGTEIKIRAIEEDGLAGVCIEDNGRGISDEMKKNVFKKKFKGKGSGGSGLGLYLVRKIAEKYGGKVEVEDSESGGAKFNIYFRKG